jgi:hypothetical protein
MSRFLAPAGVDLARTLDHLNGSLSGVTIVSGRNPMEPFVGGNALGRFVYGVFPVSLYACLLIYAVRLLTPRNCRDSSKSRQGNFLRAIIACNVVILAALLLFFLLGGGQGGILLPDSRWGAKMFNYAALSGCSAAVDMLMAFFIGNILEGKKLDAAPPIIGGACFLGLIGLDIMQSVCLSARWGSLFVRMTLLPGLLLLAEIMASLFLGRRCFLMQQRVHSTMTEVESGTKSKLLLQGLHRRLIRSGVSADRDLAARCPGDFRAAVRRSKGHQGVLTTCRSSLVARRAPRPAAGLPACLPATPLSITACFAPSLPTRQYLSAAGALSSVMCITVFNIVQAVYRPGDYLILSLSFTTARCCSIFGQLTFADRGPSCGCTRRRRVDSVLRPRPQAAGSGKKESLSA